MYLAGRSRRIGPSTQSWGNLRASRDSRAQLVFRAASLGVRASGLEERPLGRPFGGSSLPSGCCRFADSRNPATALTATEERRNGCPRATPMGSREPPEALARPAGRSRRQTSRACGASLEAPLLDGSLWVEVARGGDTSRRLSPNGALVLRFLGVRQDPISRVPSLLGATASARIGNTDGASWWSRSARSQAPSMTPAGASRCRRSADSPNPATVEGRLPRRDPDLRARG